MKNSQRLETGLVTELSACQSSQLPKIFGVSFDLISTNPINAGKEGEFDY